MKKVLLTFGLIVLVGAGAAWYFVAYRLDSLIETRIESAGTHALGSHVEVGGVTTDIRGGALRVSEITIANPSGFESPHAAKFTGIEAAVDYGSREIERVVIDQPDFVIEERDGRTNFDAMLEAIEASIPPADQDAGPEPEIVIRHFRINGARAAFDSRSLDRSTEVGIDAIDLYDLRGTPTQLAEQIARAVVGEVSSEVATALVQEQARQRLGDVKEKVGDKLRGLLGGGDETEDDEEP